MTPEQLKLLKDIYSILTPSNVCDLVYRSPADNMRRAADEMDRKEMVIEQFRKELYFWENGKYPGEPIVSSVNIIGHGTTHYEN